MQASESDMMEPTVVGDVSVSPEEGFIDKQPEFNEIKNYDGSAAAYDQFFGFESE